MEGYILHLFIMIGIYIILAMSLNLAMGYAGLANFGHAAFYGIGAYSSALLSINLGLSFWITIFVSGFFTCIIGLILSLSAIRLRGDYLALATLGFGIIVHNILLNWTSLTRGPLGIPGIPRPVFFELKFNSPLSVCILVAFFVLISYIIFRRLLSAPFGRILKALKQDEIATLSIGKNVQSYKIVALVTSAFFAGIAGSLYAHYITFIDPSSFTIMESMLIISMIIVGGLGSIHGSILGAAILILLPEPLRFFHFSPSVIGALRQIIYSVLLILIILIRANPVLRWRRRLW
ncbi:MAG: branched-chain amino acid ABC transporter permease [Candidatus Desantisbacteria bacterium]